MDEAGRRFERGRVWRFRKMRRRERIERGWGFSMRDGNGEKGVDVHVSLRDLLRRFY